MQRLVARYFSQAKIIGLYPKRRFNAGLAATAIPTAITSEAFSLIHFNKILKY